MSQFAFVDLSVSYLLPPTFDWDDYIETERELWALFPETTGARVNFVQLGLTAWLYAGVEDDGSELDTHETYILMPCPDSTMRPLRMRAARRLTLQEYRMSHLTAVKLIGRMSYAGEVVQYVTEKILGPEVLDEIEIRLNGE